MVTSLPIKREGMGGSAVITSGVRRIRRPGESW
jgi:hypothetical protein